MDAPGGDAVRRLRPLFAVLAVCLTATSCAALCSGGMRASLHETPAAKDGGVLAVVYSGDGGWARIDKAMAKALSQAGADVVGVDALRYFSTRRTPQEAADDLAQVIRRRAGARRVVLVGYSFGAGALPVMADRLPADVRGRVTHLVLIGLPQEGELKFHPVERLHLTVPSDYPTARRWRLCAD